MGKSTLGNLARCTMNHVVRGVRLQGKYVTHVDHASGHLLVVKPRAGLFLTVCGVLETTIRGRCIVAYDGVTHAWFGEGRRHSWPPYFSHTLDLGATT